METTMKTCLLLMLLFAAVPVLAQEKPATQKIEREGVEVEFTIEPIKEQGKTSELMEAKEAVVRSRFTTRRARLHSPE
jgi:hypothetical protein